LLAYFSEIKKMLKMGENFRLTTEFFYIVKIIDYTKRKSVFKIKFVAVIVAIATAVA
jgi:hypothetical protein